ncbi:putative N-acetylmannosamine-6-phosphate 2-epimerase [Pelomonas sp. V22]|uniref:N-acetylmannosamine-6-phosphate 2-epimerase n=1 Tax=Pelomonas sp. V22 TaxID=2822139 RepID=UPI0024A858B1|nr:putative N-acetylmannosamine-6-phosphate 2-epimerase [Pelomonas sp. V22]MDI4632407.1 putative N-acetylmannosamine-6-phosphate 2-epimerase [Pelomonas sp. V22]
MTEQAQQQRLAKLQSLDGSVKGGLVVSCQPVEKGPLDDDEVVLRLAQAALHGGACAVRIEGAARVARVRQGISAPVIGIVKRDLPDSPVRITPLQEDVQALVAAGADVIAVDATARQRPDSVRDLLVAIHASGAVAMADCSSLDDARAAAALGFDIVGTTLSGYTGGEVPAEPDYELLAALSREHPRVMAEGRYNTPEQAAKAITLGAWAVTVGTAITRTESVASWFSSALDRS